MPSPNTRDLLIYYRAVGCIFFDLIYMFKNIKAHFPTFVSKLTDRNHFILLLQKDSYLNKYAIAQINLPTLITGGSEATESMILRTQSRTCVLSKYPEAMCRCPAGSLCLMPAIAVMI